MNNPTIIFLDDNLGRIKKFRSNYPYSVICTTAKYTIDILTDMHSKGTLIDLLFLDHDLGSKEFVTNDGEDTGMEVVKWICQHKPMIKKIVVHSCNPPAALLMCLRLTAYNYDVVQVPFPKLGLS